MTLCSSDHFYCNNNCCKLQLREYIPRKCYTFGDTPCNITPINGFYDYTHKNPQKAGLIIYSKNTGKILLIQSNGNLWGFPKGSIEEGETVEECAIRETYEETGLLFPKNIINNDLMIFSLDKKTTFYIIPFYEIPVSLNFISKDSDSTGIAWMNISCIKDMVFSGKIKLNRNCRDILDNFFYY